MCATYSRRNRSAITSTSPPPFSASATDRLPTSTVIKASSRSSSSRIKTSKGAKKKAREIMASSKREEAGTRKRNPPKSARRYTNKSSPCIGSGGRRTFGEDVLCFWGMGKSNKKIYIGSCSSEEAAASGSISPTRSSSTSGQSLLWFTPELLAYGAGTRETRPRASNHNGVYLLKNRKAPWAASITLKLHYLSVKLDLNQQKTFSIRTLWFSSLPQAEASYDSTGAGAYETQEEAARFFSREKNLHFAYENYTDEMPQWITLAENDFIQYIRNLHGLDRKGSVQRS
ncbi:hypothetical protein SELMODRAFT_428826 [Selaginella moellendorffii]|uniref:Uncharacterized protein n=1 Tax=Selaginella moellendorffii TaxID=88036 RepID=D8T448_SELML|nr:hypothetical protein SELMODRAFT_428826 [Selaginella moellendorffii]